MFIHWGPSSIRQDGEWVMNNRGIRATEYESLLPPFNPMKFDAPLTAHAIVSMCRAVPNSSSSF